MFTSSLVIKMYYLKKKYNFGDRIYDFDELQDP
jgi:hypothetical protein